jgi:hypothetical protein
MQIGSYRNHIFSVIALVTLSVTQRVTAQQSDCSCTANVQRIVTFCVAGNTYAAAVDFCEINNNTPPYLIGGCGLRRQNRISVLRKLCFQGPAPAGVTDEQIFQYLRCSIHNEACLPGNQWGINVPMNGLYCWTISIPRCTERDANGCIVPCGNCRLCRYEMRWANTQGVCSFDQLWECHDNDTCSTGCNSSTCPSEVLCCP